MPVHYCSHLHVMEGRMLPQHIWHTTALLRTADFCSAHHSCY